VSETLVEPSSASSAPAPEPNRTFLPYLDGVRGFFGLYIGLAHLWDRTSSLRPAMLPLPQHFIAFGHNSVGMFIVISGYVLGLPVARYAQRFRGGLRLFATRRALRILPAYYAALLIAIPISLYVTPIYHEALTPRNFAISAGLHLLMLHNISNGLVLTIDNPMWSIAVESDIYVLFPLLLVPLARRWGFIPMVVTGFAVGLLPTAIGALRHQGAHYPLAESCMWYIGLFALGYAAANLSVDPRPAVVSRFERWPWGAIAVACVAALAVVIAVTPSHAETNGSRWFPDMLLGSAIAAQFTADARARRRGRTTPFERFFMLRPLLLAGTFSYSFYLVHLPIIDLGMSFVRPDWPPAAVLGTGILTFAAALGVAYAFYRTIERPFMSAYRRRGDAESLRSVAAFEIPDTAGAGAGGPPPR
jgi:peptidoglycan/LPS O-acetylase OafA/YrhL